MTGPMVAKFPPPDMTVSGQFGGYLTTRWIGLSALTRLKSHWNLISAAVNGKQVCAKMWLGCFS
jgi:hypothetical protein